jgi:heme-degrading monooxygenase HmoA
MYTIIWEFRITENQRDDFEAAYGARGRWAQLFACAPGYLGTELVCDAEDLMRYLTVDWWESAQAYEEFRSTYGAEYRELDAACEAMTSAEVFIGQFQAV